MKNIYPNNVNSNRTCIETRWTKRILYSFCVLFLLVLSSGLLVAQESRIYELTDNKAEMKSTLAEQQNVDFNKLHSLVYDLHPTVYVQDNKIELTPEESPSVLKLENIESFNSISTSTESYIKIELVVIRLNTPSEINTTLDFATLNGFDSLKYILVECSFNCTEPQIRNLISNSNPDVTIFFHETIEQ